MPDIIIIGAGAAGTLTAAQLLRQAKAKLKVTLIERRGDVGRGVAYGAAFEDQLLNVPARHMSAWPDDPNHFVRWLETTGREASPGAFLPRLVYGEYLAAVLAEAERSPATLQRVTGEAIGILPAGEAYRVRLADSTTLLASAVVLALGQFLPAPLRVAAAVAEQPWYVADSWSAAATAALPPGGAALVVGTGLTGVDVALALLSHAGAAQVTMVSRHGRLPAAQHEGPPYAAHAPDALGGSRVSALLASLRAETAAAQDLGHDWRAVVDARRVHADAAWRRLPHVERRRFLRHARTLWEAHRNRLPPPTAARVAAEQAAGRLRVLAGRVKSLSNSQGGPQATLATPQGEETLAIARAVNCTGPDGLYRRNRHPLVLDLIGTGLARPDALGLGLDVAPDGRLLDEDGRPAPGLFTLGWPRLGESLEATAIAGIRVHAQQVAASLLQ